MGDGFKVAVFYYFVIALLPCTSLAASNFLAIVRIISKCFFLIFLHNWSTYLRCIRNVNELVSLFTLVVIVLSVAEIDCCSSGRFSDVSWRFSIISLVNSHCVLCPFCWDVSILRFKFHRLFPCFYLFGFESPGIWNQSS